MQARAGVWEEKMKAVGKFLLVACVIAISPSAAKAELISYVQFALGGGGGCSFQSVSVGPAVASCGSYEDGDGMDAIATYGALRARSLVDGPSRVINDGTKPLAADFWRGGASLFDTLNFSIDSGTFRLNTDIAVSFTEKVTGFFAGSVNSSGASNNVLVEVNSSTIFQRYHRYDNGQSGFAELVEAHDFGSQGQGFVDLEFTEGSLSLNAQLFLEAGCGTQHTSTFDNKVGSCLLGANAFNSLRLIGGTVFAPDGSVVENGFVSSGSGFDYSVGVAPHAASTLSEPSGFAWLALGSLGLGLAARRKRLAR